MATTFSPASYNGDKPNGWIDNWISQGQMFGGYGGGNAYIQETLTGFRDGLYGFSSSDGTPWAIDPSNTAALDALVSYAFNGNVKDNRYAILGSDELLKNGKGPWQISENAKTDFVPVYVIYTNDASTSEDNFSLAVDMLPSSGGGSTTGNPIAVNILINSAITAGSFLGARIKAAMDARGVTNINVDPSSSGFKSEVLAANKYQNFVNGDILFTPDGFSAFAKNYSALKTVNNGRSVVVASSINTTGDGSWQITDNGGKQITWPSQISISTKDRTTGNSTLQTYSVQPVDATSFAPVRSVAAGTTANITAGYQTSDGSYAAFPDLNLDDRFDFKNLLEDAIDYLKTNQKSLEQIGVVFPDNFSTVTAGSSFSPRPGVTLPALEFSGTFDDYLAAQAWLIKLFAGPLNVSTVLNVWRGSYDPQLNQAWSGSNSSFREDSPELNNLTSSSAIRSTIDTIADTYSQNAKALGWSKAAPYFDYMAIDKYEQDELSGRIQGSLGGMYNHNGWINYLYFTQALAQRLPTGIGASYDPSSKTTRGNIDTMLFQMPTAPVVLANADGSANQTYYTSAGWGGTENQPHLSSAFDVFFGNPHLTGESAIKNNFKQWLDPTYTGPDFIERGGTSQNSLADYMFSTRANALQEAGPHNLTQGLLTPGDGSSGPTINPIFNHIFSVLWGGGNTSAPINWRDSAWPAVAAATDPTNTSNGYVKNKWNTAVLDNVMQRLDSWSESNELLTNGTSYDGEVVPHSTALFNSALQVAGSSGTQTVTLRLVDQGLFGIQWGLFKLDPSDASLGDPITGSTGGKRPEDDGYADAVRAAVTNSQTGTGWIVDSGKGRHSDVSLSLQAGGTYGIALLVPSVGGGALDTLVTSIAAANPGGKAHAALLPTAQLMSALNLSIPAGSHATTQTIGFEDQIANPDWDFNDASFTVISGASVLV